MGEQELTDTSSVKIKSYSAMVISPHPDDAELGMGGTLALLSRQCRTVVLDLTNGEPTPFGSPEIRLKESQEATKLLGMTAREQLNLPCREVFDGVEARKLVAERIRKYRPEILFLPYWIDAHPDHIQSSWLGEAARFYSKLVKSDIAGEPWYPKKVFYFFSNHYRIKLTPDFLVDISSVLDLKERSLRCYRSQFEDNPANAKMIDRVMTETRYWGHQVNAEGAEPFMCREPIAIRRVENLFEL